MRKTLNENPVVQVVLVGVLGIIVALLFMSRMSAGGGAEPEAAPSAAAPAESTAAAPAAIADAEAAPPDATSPGTGAQADTLVPAGAPGFTAGAGLPKRLVAAYDRGQAIVLLVTERRGIEDKQVRSDVAKLRSRGDAAVFIVTARKVARFSRVAEGVDLQRAPAIVIVKPRRVTEGPLPEATVSYGYRGPGSVAQTLRDSFYDGKYLPYHPR